MHEMENNAASSGGHGLSHQEPAVEENQASNASNENRPSSSSDEYNSGPSKSVSTAADGAGRPDTTEELENPQLVSPTPDQPKDKPGSNRKHYKSVRELKYLGIKPIVVWNRKQGKRTYATGVHYGLVKRHGNQLKPQLRTVQRIIQEIERELDKEEQRLNRPEVYFRQEYHPGEVAQLDCSSLASLKITINGKPFKGKIFTFKLMYSKWIYACIVSNENAFEVLAAIENALWELKGVPLELRSDNGKALFARAKEATQAYADLCSHYGTSWSSINPGHPNENGGAETGNRSVKIRLRYRLTTDVDRNFPDLDDLKALLREEVKENNAEVEPKFNEERRHLGRLPRQRVEAYLQINRAVNKEGLVTYDSRGYSAPPDLHGEKKVQIRIYTDRLVIYDHDGKLAWDWPLATDTEARVDFRHVIHWLKRKPGAFKDYAHKDQLFPTAIFRRAYEKFAEWYAPLDAVKNLLPILALATGPNPIRQGDDELIKEVDCALGLLLEKGERFTYPDVVGLVGPSPDSRLPEVWSNVTQTAFGE